MKEKLQKVDKKTVLLGVLIVGIISMSVAFAALSTRLNINGTTNVAATKWNIRFENWEKANPATAGGHTNTVVSPEVNELDMKDGTNVTKVSGINVTLNQPGDTAKYTFEIANRGTIDAKLDNFTVTDTSENNLVGYEVKCYDQEEKGNEITTNSVLAVEQVVYCYMQVTYKEQTNSHTAGQNQIYNQEAVSTSISASWTWVQNDGSSSSQSGGNEQGTSTSGSGEFIKGGTTGWKLVTARTPLENQEFEYWTTTEEKIMSGWHELEDYYGHLQEYYFENGLAKKGWLTYNSNRYYLSTFDDDENGYINFNMLKNETREIDGQCYTFASDGKASESNGCGGSANNWDIYYTPTQSSGGSTLPNDAKVWIQENRTSGVKQVCGVLTNGTVCFNQDNVDYKSADEIDTDGANSINLKNAFETAGNKSRLYFSTTKIEFIDTNGMDCGVDEYGYAQCTDSTTYAACNLDSSSGTPNCY